MSKRPSKKRIVFVMCLVSLVVASIAFTGGKGWTKTGGSYNCQTEICRK
jgi:hypothetical protein